MRLELELAFKNCTLGERIPILEGVKAMARPKTFDRDDVLERAMQLFWTRGYERTSIQDLVEAMGINRGSLYDTFIDKESLYREALERYRAGNGQGLSRVIERTHTPREAIETYLRQVAATGADALTKRGCFIANTVTEFGASEHPIAEAARGAVRDIEATFAGLVEKGQSTGEIRRDQAPDVLAAYLTTALNGIRVLVKADESKEQLDRVVSLTMDTLNDRAPQ